MRCRWMFSHIDHVNLIVFRYQSFCFCFGCMLLLCCKKIRECSFVAWLVDFKAMLANLMVVYLHMYVSFGYARWHYNEKIQTLRFDIANNIWIVLYVWIESKINVLSFRVESNLEHRNIYNNRMSVHSSIKRSNFPKK